MDRSEHLKTIRAAARDTTTAVLRLIDIIHAIKLDGLVQHAPKIAELLRHDKDILRESAIETLVGMWELPEYVPGVIEMLQHDPPGAYERARGEHSRASSVGRRRPTSSP